jgi:hypothetical protein
MERSGISETGAASRTAMLRDHRFTLVHDAGFQDVEPRYGLPALSIGGERITLAEKA